MHWVSVPSELKIGEMVCNAPAWEAVELTPLRGGRHDGAEGAISTKQYTCLH